MGEKSSIKYFNWDFIWVMKEFVIVEKYDQLMWVLQVFVMFVVLIFL